MEANWCRQTDTHFAKAPASLAFNMENEISYTPYPEANKNILGVLITLLVKELTADSHCSRFASFYFEQLLWK